MYIHVCTLTAPMYVRTYVPLAVPLTVLSSRVMVVPNVPLTTDTHTLIPPEDSFVA